MYCFVAGEGAQSCLVERANKSWEVGSSHTVDRMNSSVHGCFPARMVTDIDSPGSSSNLHHLELS